MLTVVDIFSKYGWMIPLNNKAGTEVASALQKVFKKGKPEKLWVDKGKEFYNKHVQQPPTWHPRLITSSRKHRTLGYTFLGRRLCRILMAGPVLMTSQSGVIQWRPWMNLFTSVVCRLATVAVSQTSCAALA